MELQSLVDLVLEDVQIVCGCDSDNVLLGVPRRVKDLLAEVQAIDADLVLTTLPAYTHLEDRGRDGCQDELKRILCDKIQKCFCSSSIKHYWKKHTLRGLRMALGLLFSLDASSVTSRFVFRSNIRKKLL